MLHTKFRANRPAGSGEDVLRDFSIHGRGGHLGHVTHMPRTKLCSPYPRRLHIKFGFDRPSGFEKVFEHCERQTDGQWTEGRRRTPDHGYTISSHMGFLLRSANKTQVSNALSLSPFSYLT